MHHEHFKSVYNDFTLLSFPPYLRSPVYSQSLPMTRIFMNVKRSTKFRSPVLMSNITPVKRKMPALRLLTVGSKIKLVAFSFHQL